jgi:hypothetical protein
MMIRRQALLCAMATWSLNMSAQSDVIGDIVGAVNIDSMITYVEEMTGEVPVDLGNGPITITSRHADHAGNALAQQYYEQRFAAWGYAPAEHVFNATGTNVLVTKPGTVHPEEIVVLCAHYDSKPAGTLYNAPGADDDGSGCAAVLEAARILRDIPFERTIVFALWDQEEQGKIGSMHYANMMAANDEAIVGVVNMDAIAYDGNGDRKARVHARAVANSMAIADTVFAVLDRYALDVDLLLTTPGETYSDHASFWSAGYGAVLVIEEFAGDGNPNYHTPNDRVQYFDVPYFEDLAKLSIASAAALAIPHDPTAAVVDMAPAAPALMLYAYPNPTADMLRVWVNVPKTQQHRVVVLNAIGEQVQLLADGVLREGRQEFVLAPGVLAPGAYVVVAYPEQGEPASVRVLRVP